MSRQLQIMIGIAAVLGVTFFALFAEKDSILTETQPKENFVRTGNLVQNNPGQKADVWYLVYEEPGKPALSKELHFTKESLCADILCHTASLQVGDRVSVTGELLGETVTVVRLSPYTSTQNGNEIMLFYYAPERDKDEAGNLLCSRAGLVSVRRVLPKTENTEANIEAAIELLLRGEISEEERADGITTEFPLPEFALKKVQLENGVLTLTFDDPAFKTGGGSCRVGILWSEIEATAKQFEGVREVRFSPEELFQP